MLVIVEKSYFGKNGVAPWKQVRCVLLSKKSVTFFALRLFFVAKY